MAKNILLKWQKSRAEAVLVDLKISLVNRLFTGRSIHTYKQLQKSKKIFINHKNDEL